MTSVLGKREERFTGILLKYNEALKKDKNIVNVNNKVIKNVNVGFIGAGSFAQSYLLPNVCTIASLDTVVTKTRTYEQ